MAVAFVALLGFSGFESTFALFGDRRLHLHLASTGAVFTGVGIMIVVVQGGLVRPAIRAAGESRVLVGGLVANGVGLALLTGVHSLPALVPALLALTVGQGLLAPVLASALAARAGPQRRGRVLGLQQGAGGLARVVGPVLAGFAFGHLGVAVPYAAGAVLMLVAAVVAATGADVSPAGPSSLDGPLAPEAATPGP
jgi:MFS family permease